MTDELLIHDLAEVATPRGNAPLSGTSQGRIDRLRGAEVLCREGRIAFVGSPEERQRRFGDLPDVERHDGGGGVLLPGFVDPHTHLPWAGDRAQEFARRLAGADYREIAAAGGGILATVRATRQASVEELTRLTLERLDRMLVCGTTTAEAKSGYCLDHDGELKQLEAIRAADTLHAIDLVPTLLAAHETPPEHRSDRARWLDVICGEIVPAAAEQGLAAFCDVFCEQGVFTAAESRRVLEAGAEHGLAPRLHADEFADSGGAELAAALGAASADHLIAVSEEGIAALAAAGVIAVLLPGTSFFLLRHRYAPARRLIEAGVPVALATDCNPGSSNTESMPTILTLAVYELGLSIEEALVAATLNAAASLRRADEIGTVEEGKRADLVIADAPALEHLAYHYGVNPVRSVIKDGRLSWQASEPKRPRESPPPTGA